MVAPIIAAAGRVIVGSKLKGMLDDLREGIQEGAVDEAKRFGIKGVDLEDVVKQAADIFIQRHKDDDGSGATPTGIDNSELSGSRIVADSSDLSVTNEYLARILDTLKHQTVVEQRREEREQETHFEGREDRRSLLEKIKTLGGNAGEGLKKGATSNLGMATVGGALTYGVMKFFSSDVFKEMSEMDIGDFLSKRLTEAKDSLYNFFGSMYDSVVESIENDIAAFSDFGTKIFRFVSDKFSDVGNLLVDQFVGVVNSFKSMLDNVITYVKNIPGLPDFVKDSLPKTKSELETERRQENRSIINKYEESQSLLTSIEKSIQEERKVIGVRVAAYAQANKLSPEETKAYADEQMSSRRMKELLGRQQTHVEYQEKHRGAYEKAIKSTDTIDKDVSKTEKTEQRERERSFRDLINPSSRDVLRRNRAAKSNPELGGMIETLATLEENAREQFKAGTLTQESMDRRKNEIVELRTSINNLIGAPMPTESVIAYPGQKESRGDVGIDAAPITRSSSGQKESRGDVGIDAAPITRSSSGNVGIDAVTQAAPVTRSSSGNVGIDAVTQAAPITRSSGGEASKILDLIGQKESRGDYNALVYGKNTPKSANLTEMTLEEVFNYQSGMIRNGHASTAVGKYQFINSTLREAAAAIGISGSTRFAPEVQDQLAMYLLNKRGWSKFKSGEISKEQFATNLSKEWASFPKDASGISYYAGVAGNKAGVKWDTVMATLGGEPVRGVAPSSVESVAIASLAPATPSTSGSGLIAAQSQQSEKQQELAQAPAQVQVINTPASKEDGLSTVTVALRNDDPSYKKIIEQLAMNALGITGSPLASV